MNLNGRPTSRLLFILQKQISSRKYQDVGFEIYNFDLLLYLRHFFVITLICIFYILLNAATSRNPENKAQYLHNQTQVNFNRKLLVFIFYLF
jgi:hypothetical protein